MANKRLWTYESLIPKKISTFQVDNEIVAEWRVLRDIVSLINQCKAILKEMERDVGVLLIMQGREVIHRQVVITDTALMEFELERFRSKGNFVLEPSDGRVK